MRVLGLTGGIATGKSTAVEMFRRMDVNAVVFDADQCVRSLYADKVVLAGLADIVGQAVLSDDGQLDRAYLRGRLFSEPRLKSTIEGFIHPKVRKQCLASLENAAITGTASSFIADVPLLFEGGFDFGQDANLVVAVSRATQERRLIMRNGFDEATVRAILEAQIPISDKQKCADFVFWNEGSKCVLEAQIKRFIENKYQ